VQRRLEAAPRAVSTLTNLGPNALRRGDPREARRRYAKSLEAVRKQGDKVTAADCLEGLAWVSVAEGHADRALLLA
jgi:Tfp pilus assembly protein PilF